MKHTETLDFESARILQATLGNELGNLKLIEDRLRVTATTRDGWIKFDGEKKDVVRACKVIDVLRTAQQKGLPIKKQELQYALDTVDDAEAVSLSELHDARVEVSPKKPFIVPKRPAQKAYVEAIRHHDLVFGAGPAGTGKTYLAMACAIGALRRDEVKRIVLTRPAVEAGEALGFLPGDLKDKVLPFLRPLYDALNDMLDTEELARYVERGAIEIAPLAYMRGRTLGQSFIVLDEAQNTTTEQMFMFLTRLGPGSKCVVTGDPTQIDLPRTRKSGLVEARQALRDTAGVAFCDFDEADVVRHDLVQRIIRAYRAHRGDQMTSMHL